MIKPKRAAAKPDQNPVAIVLLLLLEDPRWKFELEQHGKFKGNPWKEIEDVKRKITVKSLPNSVQYHLFLPDIECDIRVVADNRLAENWTVNPYHKIYVGQLDIKGPMQ